MHPEKYCLTWDTYSEHLKDMVKEMMNDDLADVTLVTEDKKHIRVHKIILSACSPVFRDILKLDQSAKPIIFLKGIHFSEIDSIMQFIYVGKVTFYEERMNQFLDVARSLEIKEMCNAQTETIKEKEPSPSSSVTQTDNSEEEQTIRSSHLMNQAPRHNRDRREVVRVNSKYECEQCDKKYTSQLGLKYHRQSAHEGVKYAMQSDLKRHISAKH